MQAKESWRSFSLLVTSHIFDQTLRNIIGTVFAQPSYMFIY